MVIINSLKNNGITTLEWGPLIILTKQSYWLIADKLTMEGFEHGKKVINDPKNLAIIPTPLQLQVIQYLEFLLVTDKIDVF